MIVDAHLHLWDPARLRYPWLAGNELLHRPYLPGDFRRASADCDVEAMIFVQCEAEPGQYLLEAEWVAALAEHEPRIAAIVAWAPLELGAPARASLEQLAQLELVRGVRRIVQFEPDPEFCLQPDFIQGVKLLAEFGLTFDICTDWSRLPYVVRFARAVPGVRMVLDHIGKPPIAAGFLEPWATHLRELAHLPHVWCKMSGVATEADHSNWNDSQLAPYIDTAIQAFGCERLMFGGDWPVSTQAIDYRRWVELLQRALAGASTADRDRFWRRNALDFYGLAT